MQLERAEWPEECCLGWQALDCGTLRASMRRCIFTYDRWALVMFVKAPFWAAGAVSSLGWGRTHTHTTCRNLHKTDFIDVGLLARSVWAPEQGL